MIRLVALLLVFLASFPALAAAAVIDQAGADALKPRVSAALDGFAASFKNTGGTLRREGELMVEPAGTYYAITTPSLSLQKPDGNIRTIGMVAINAIPTTDPDIFKVAIALPTPMLETDAAGTPVGNLSIAQQAMNGLWHMQALAFTELNGNYKNVVITDNVKKSEITIPDITAMMKLTPEGTLWSGPSETVISNLGYKDPLSTYTISVMHIKSNIRQMDLVASKQMTAATQSVLNAQDLRSAFISNLSRMANSVETTLTADTITYKNTLPDGRVQSGAVRAAALQASASNLKSQSALATLNLSLDGLTNDDPAMARLSPSHALLKLVARNLPLEKLFAATDKAAQRAALAQARSSFEIQTLNIDAPVYGLDAKGTMLANAAAPLGYTGRLNIMVRGVDALMTMLADPKAAGAPGMEIVPPPIVAMLSVIQLTGKVGTDAAGRDVRTYDIIMSEDGKVTLNGADISPMVQAVKPAAPAGALKAAPVK